MGRLVSLVTGRAALKGSAASLTQMLRVLFNGFRKAMYLPSGESCAPEISGSPKNSSRSIIGGSAALKVVAKLAIRDRLASFFIRAPPSFLQSVLYRAALSSH